MCFKYVYGCQYKQIVTCSQFNCVISDLNINSKPKEPFSSKYTLISHLCIHMCISELICAYSFLS